MVAPEAGTTRDAIDSLLRYQGKSLKFVDTAGLRRRAKVEDDLEFYSTLRPSARSSERRCACWWWTRRSGCTTRISGSRPRRGTRARADRGRQQVGPGRGEGRQHRAPRQEELIEKAPFLRYVPFVYVSALTGQRVRKVLDLILEVARRGSSGCRPRR